MEVLIDVVAFGILAKSPITLLHLLKSFNDIDNPLPIHIIADSSKTGENRSDSIDIVDAPPGTPHSIFPGLHQEFDGFDHNLMILQISLAHCLKEMANYIGTGGIENLRTFINFRQFEDAFDKLILVIVFVFIKGGKSSIPVLIASKPFVGSYYLVLIGSKICSSWNRSPHFTV